MESTQGNNLSIQDTPNKEPVANCDRLAMPIENRILTLRGKQVMIDRDLAELYGVETKRLNEQVRRIDEEVYHIGHSLKDLGKKLFAFSKMDVVTDSELLSKL